MLVVSTCGWAFAASDNTFRSYNATKTRIGSEIFDVLITKIMGSVYHLLMI